MIKRSLGIFFISFSIILFVINNTSYYYKLETNKVIPKNNNGNYIEYVKDFTHNIGYLYIDTLNIKQVIKKGTSEQILNNNNVGLYKNGVEIDDNIGQIILAGHNNKYVFGNLYKIKNNDKIIIETKQGKQLFIVNNKIIINSNDTSYFKKNSSSKELILITCINKNKRLLIFAKKIQI